MLNITFNVIGYSLRMVIWQREYRSRFYKIITSEKGVLSRFLGSQLTSPARCFLTENRRRTDTGLSLRGEREFRWSILCSYICINKIKNFLSVPLFPSVCVYFCLPYGSKLAVLKM